MRRIVPALAVLLLFTLPAVGREELAVAHFAPATGLVTQILSPSGLQIVGELPAWNYASFLVRDKWEPLEGSVTIEVVIVPGPLDVGIGVLERDSPSTYLIERIATASPERQVVRLLIPDVSKAGRLVIRNGSKSGQFQVLVSSVRVIDSVGRVGNAVVPTTAPEPASSGCSPQNAGCQNTAAERIRLNGYFLPRVQFEVWRESRPRNVEASSLNLRTTRLATMRAAPLDVKLITRLEREWAGKRYTIDVLTWQALPGINMPAAIYRPSDWQDKKLPLVLSPLSCSSSVATHSEAVSVQRRMTGFALSDMAAFTTLGLCENGYLSKVPGMTHNFGYWGLVAGEGMNTRALEVVLWQRALDLLERLPGLEFSRVAVTGYGNGSNIANSLFGVDDRVTALADVAWIKEGQFQDWGPLATYTPRLGSRFQYRHNFYHGGYRWTDNPLHTATDPSTVLRDHYRPPRPLLFITGDDKRWGYFRHTDNIFTTLTDLYRSVGAPVMPTLAANIGGRDFDARKVDLVTRWLAEVFGVTAVDAKTLDGFPLIETNALEPPVTNTATLYSIMSDIARDAMEVAAKKRANDTADPQTRISDIAGTIGMPAAGPNRRPILLDEWFESVTDKRLKLEYWLVPAGGGLVTGMVTAYPVEGAITGVALSLDTETGTPSAAALRAAAEGTAQAVLVIPGYGATSSATLNTGNLAGVLAQDGNPLLGIAVAAVRDAVGAVKTMWPDAPLTLTAEGIEPGIVGAFAAALEPAINATELHHALTSFHDLLDAPKPLFIPPILLGSRLMTGTDIGELQALAAPRSLRIVSPPSKADFDFYANIYSYSADCVPSRVGFVVEECEGKTIP